MKNLQKHREKACKIRGYSYISRCKKGKEKKKVKGEFPGGPVVIRTLLKVPHAVWHHQI